MGLTTTGRNLFLRTHCPWWLENLNSCPQPSLASEGAAIAREEAVAIRAMGATVRADLKAMGLGISELCGRACFPR